MSGVSRCLGLVFLYVCCLPTALHAQVINAASCSQADVQTALNSVTASTTTVNIPSGTCTWISNINFTVPSGSTSLTIQGQTTCTGSGDPAQNNLVCTDGTIIVDSTPALGFIQITTNSSTSSSGLSSSYLIGIAAVVVVVIVIAAYAVLGRRTPNPKPPPPP